MEAIKKKMQAMKVEKDNCPKITFIMIFAKVEKDNACDRVDVCEEQCKAARVRTIFSRLFHFGQVSRCWIV